MGERGRDIEEESLEETNLDSDLATGVGLVFVWVERRQQGELRGLHAVPVVAVAVHGHLPGAELRENAPTAAGARGRLAVVLVRGGGREKGRHGGQDDQEPRHAGTRGSRLRDRAEPEALSVVGDSESLKVRLVSHTAAAAWNEEASVAGLVGARKFRICPRTEGVDEITPMLSNCSMAPGSIEWGGLIPDLGGVDRRTSTTVAV